jgi:DNA gyrase subunit B
MVTLGQMIPFYAIYRIYSYDTVQEECMNCLFLNKNYNYLTDRRKNRRQRRICTSDFHSDVEKLKEFVRFLDKGRRGIISHVIIMDHEKGEIL